MKTLVFLTLVFTSLVSTASAQIDLTFTKAKSLVGVTNLEKLGSRTIVGEDSIPQVSEVVIVTVSSVERVRLIVKKDGLSKKQTVPIELLSSVVTDKITTSKYLLANEGSYEIAAISASWDADIEFTIGTPTPTPPPTPVDPPTPTPPTPGPVTSFHVIMVKESGSTLPIEQNSIAGAKVIRDYLTSKTTPEGGFAGFREFDPQQNIANEQPTMKALWTATKSSVTTVPCLVVEVNGKVSILPYPKNVTEALSVLKTYGGP